MKYQIHELSAKAIMRYAAETSSGVYKYNLTEDATNRCISFSAPTVQDVCALFYQTMCMLHGDDFKMPVGVEVIPDLSDILITVDFSGIFDRTATENEEILERYWFALAPAFPATLAEKLSGFTLTKNTIGCSASGVYHCQSETDCLYLKIQKLNAGVIKELEIISWLDGKLPVPKIKYFYEDNGYSYLLMTAVDGYMSCECPGDELLKPFENTVKLLAEGLLMLQNVDITDCPFENSLSIKLKDALYNIEHGLVNLDYFEEDNDFDTPMDLYHWLTENKPPEELFFTHGDYCLPNIFIDGNSITGFIDLGNAGIADKWQDIALCVWSIGYNLRNCEEKDRYVRMLFDYLNIEPDWEKIKYYILLDELF